MTVDAPDVALREIKRVLHPNGQLLFIEHVGSDAPLLARWQDRLARVATTLLRQPARLRIPPRATGSAAARGLAV